MTHWQHPPQVHIPPDLLNFTADSFLTHLLIRRGITGVSGRGLFWILRPTTQPRPPTCRTSTGL